MLTVFSPHPSGRPELLVTVSSDGRVNLWDTVTSTLRLPLVRPRHLASRWTCVAWQAPRPTGSGKSKTAAPGLLALGSDTGLVVVWDVQRGEVVHELEAHSGAVHDVVFDSGSALLRFVSPRPKPKPAASPTARSHPSPAPAPAPSRALTPYSCGEDRLIKSWSCESGEQLDVLKAGAAHPYP